MKILNIEGSLRVECSLVDKTLVDQTLLDQPRVPPTSRVVHSYL